MWNSFNMVRCLDELCLFQFEFSNSFIDGSGFVIATDIENAERIARRRASKYCHKELNLQLFPEDSWKITITQIDPNPRAMITHCIDRYNH